MKLALVVILALVAIACAARVRMASTSNHPADWSRAELVADAQPIEFSLLLKRANLAKLDEVHAAVSDPESPMYGRFLSMDEVQALVRPAEAVFERIRRWVAPFGAAVQLTETADNVRVSTTAAVAAQLLRTRFALFQHKHIAAAQVVRATGDVTLPAAIARTVDLVTGVTEFVHEAVRRTKYVPLTDDDNTAGQARRLGDQDPLIWPATLKSYYGVPAGTKVINATNRVGIAAFTDFFSSGALKAFAENQSLPVPVVTVIGPDCLKQKCDEYESDLDTQYASSMAEGAPMTFYNQKSGAWVLEFTEGAPQVVPSPLIWSISYGWSELAQCEITSDCQQFGYSTQQYVARTNTGFQKLGAAGLTIFVSSGDDGAPSFGGASGQCPLDYNHYCPMGGCEHTTTQCIEFAIKTTNNASGPLCIFPMGLESDACQGFVNDATANAALAALSKANTKCSLAFESDVRQQPHVYSSCACSDLTYPTFGHYKFEQFVEDSSIPIFAPDYPTSSPYVTSVGASQFTNGGAGEQICSILNNGALITSGGGFSSFQAQPSWQAAAIAKYVANLTLPAGSFNAQGRAYPDITALGHHYMVAASPGGDSCGAGCTFIPVDGTSCSSPMLAGLFTLINDQLLNAGYSPLGFLSPLLYSALDNCPTCFNHNIPGNNACNRGYCCQYGYPSTTEWDAASGVGSPKFTPLLNYIMAQKDKANAKFAASL